MGMSQVPRSEREVPRKDRRHAKAHVEDSVKRLAPWRWNGFRSNQLRGHLHLQTSFRVACLSVESTTDSARKFSSTSLSGPDHHVKPEVLATTKPRHHRPSQGTPPAYNGKRPCSALRPRRRCRQSGTLSSTISRNYTEWFMWSYLDSHETPPEWHRWVGQNLRH